MLNTRTGRPGKKTRWKKLWPATAAAALVMVIACLILLAAQLRVPTDTNTRIGTGRLTADYELAYKPDSLYNQPKPGDKEARLLAYIDHVTWKLSYQLTGFEGLPADFEYSVDAQIIAQATETNKYIDPDFTVWQKDYQLVPPTEIVSDGSSDSLSKQVDMNIQQYFDFAKSVLDKTQVPTSNQLKVIFHVKATVHGPLEDTVDNSAVELDVPMMDNLLVVSGTPTTVNKIEMETVPPVAAPNYTLWLVICGTLALLMMTLTVLLATQGREPDISGRFAKATEKIFKQYGERMVRLENPLPYQQLATIAIDGVAEIIKIADEINQPVFYYRVDTVEEKKIEFYVFDSGRIYYMVIFGDMDKAKE